MFQSLVSFDMVVIEKNVTTATFATWPSWLVWA